MAMLAAAQSRLAARLLETHTAVPVSSDLVDAATLAARWQLPKSHMMTKYRAGVLPGIRVGKYIRFDPEACREALANPTHDRGGALAIVSDEGRIHQLP